MFYWLRKNLCISSQSFWDCWNNLFKQWKVSTIFETECFFNWRFLRSNTLEFKLEKIVVARWLRKLKEKVISLKLVCSFINKFGTLHLFMIWGTFRSIIAHQFRLDNQITIGDLLSRQKIEKRRRNGY